MKRSPISAWTIFGAALLMRFAYIKQLHASVLWDDLPVDLGYYRDWAIRISQGEWIGTEPFEQSPLYAYLLGLIFKLFGTGLMVPRLVQAVIGAASCAYIFRITRHAFGRGAALAAGLMASFYGPFLFYDGMIMKESLAVFFFCVFTLHLLESDLRQGGMLWSAGLMLGLGALVRDNMILVAPVIGMYLLIDPWVRPRDDGPSAPRDALSRLVAFSFGVALSLAPVAARHYFVAGELIPLTTGGGEVFYIGNNAGADGRYSPPPFVRPQSGVEHEDFRIEAARRLGLPAGSITRAASSSYWLQQGLEWIEDNPLSWLALEWRKLLLFLNHYELPDNQNYAHHRKLLPLLRLPLVTFAWLVPLAAAGFVLTLRRWRDLIPLYLALDAYSLSVLVFFVFARFRLPAAALLLVFAGAGLVATAQEIAAMRWRRVMLAAIAILVGILFVIPDLEDDPLHIGQSHAQLAELLRRAGRLDDAAEEAARGVELLEPLHARFGSDPEAPVSLPAILAQALRTQADILEARRKGTEAAALRRRADELDPPTPARRHEDAEGRVARLLHEAEALHKEGRLAEALRRALQAQVAADRLRDPARSLSLADAHFGQALVHRDLGERDRMKDHMRACLRANPAHPRADYIREMLAAP